MTTTTDLLKSRESASAAKPSSLIDNVAMSEKADEDRVQTARCSQAFPHTEFWGDVVVWGASNKKDSWEDCCAHCGSHRCVF